MSSWRLTVRADEDLVDLYLYGIETFGFRSATDYVETLTRCFDLLVVNPRMGRPANVPNRRARRFEHRRHVIFYEQEANDVLILGIIHQRSVREIDI